MLTIYSCQQINEVDGHISIGILSQNNSTPLETYCFSIKKASYKFK